MRSSKSGRRRSIRTSGRSSSGWSKGGSGPETGFVSRSKIGKEQYAQVVAGVGFIGAGTIIVTRRQRVKGLTTAAGLWSAAIIGLTLGPVFMRAVFWPPC
nr:MgtC/SapB family protein [Pseudoflavonifractor phocaeensis]